MSQYSIMFVSCSYLAIFLLAYNYCTPPRPSPCFKEWYAKKIDPVTSSLMMDARKNAIPECGWGKMNHFETVLLTQLRSPTAVYFISFPSSLPFHHHCVPSS